MTRPIKSIKYDKLEMIIREQIEQNPMDTEALNVLATKVFPTWGPVYAKRTCAFQDSGTLKCSHEYSAFKRKVCPLRTGYCVFRCSVV